mgnify:CR=1 FL=1
MPPQKVRDEVRDERESIGRTQWLDGFRRTKTGGSFQDCPEECLKCNRVIKGDVCPFCGYHMPLR